MLRDLPAIIDRKTFALVQTRLDALNPKGDAVYKPGVFKGNYLLSGLLRCQCGGAMTGAEAKSGRYRYDECSRQAKSGRQVCGMKRIPQTLLEKVMLDHVTTELLTEQNIARLIEHLDSEKGGQMHEWRERLRGVEQELKDVRNKLARLYEAVESGTITNADLAPRIHQRREQEVELEKTQSELRTLLAHPPSYKMHLADVRRYVIEWRRTLAEVPINRKRALLQSFVQRITLEWDGSTWRAGLKYALPAPLEIDAGSIFLGSIRNGRAYGNRTRHLRLERPTS